MLCHGGAGAESLLYGNHCPDGLQPEAPPDGEVPLLHGGGVAAVGSAAVPAAHVSKGGHFKSKIEII